MSLGAFPGGSLEELHVVGWEEAFSAVTHTSPPSFVNLKIKKEGKIISTSIINKLLLLLLLLLLLQWNLFITRSLGP